MNKKSFNDIFPHNSRLQNEFKENYKRLKQFFPNAYDFIDYLIKNKSTGFWLSTATNAHLYFKDCFILRIEFNENHQLKLLPKYRGSIVAGTQDKSHILFSEINNLINSLNGYQNDWAVPYKEDIIINKVTPSVFFDKLIETINKLKW